MTKLFICNTYMQLIMAVHIKLTMFKEDVVDIWLTDSSKGAKNVSDRLSKHNLFRNVKYITWCSDVKKQTIKEKVKAVIRYNFFPVKEIEDMDCYDEILFYNPNIQILQICDYYDKIGHKTIWSRFDEGILSYNTELQGGKTVSISRNLRRHVSRTDPFSDVSRYYCLFPSFKETNCGCETIKVPSIEKDIESLKNILNDIFDYTPERLPKYVFFASSSDIDGHPFGETEFVIKLAEHVGKENFMVKMHPRDFRKNYQEAGLQVMHNSQVPWEIMQLNLKAEDLHLLTIHSGSFISVTAMMDNNHITGDFLFNCIKCHKAFHEERSYEIHKQLERLHDNNLCMGLSDILKSIREIKL